MALCLSFSAPWLLEEHSAELSWAVTWNPGWLFDIRGLYYIYYTTQYYYGDYDKPRIQDPYKPFNQYSVGLSPQTSPHWHPRCVNVLECLVTAVFDVAQPRSSPGTPGGFRQCPEPAAWLCCSFRCGQGEKKGEKCVQFQGSNPQIATSWWWRGVVEVKSHMKAMNSASENLKQHLQSRNITWIMCWKVELVKQQDFGYSTDYTVCKLIPSMQKNRDIRPQHM